MPASLSPLAGFYSCLPSIQCPRRMRWLKVSASSSRHIWNDKNTSINEALERNEYSHLQIQVDVVILTKRWGDGNTFIETQAMFFQDIQVKKLIDTILKHTSNSTYQEHKCSCYICWSQNIRFFTRLTIGDEVVTTNETQTVELQSQVFKCLSWRRLFLLVLKHLWYSKISRCSSQGLSGVLGDHAS